MVLSILSSSFRPIQSNSIKIHHPLVSSLSLSSDRHINNLERLIIISIIASHQIDVNINLLREGLGVNEKDSNDDSQGTAGSTASTNMMDFLMDVQKLSI